MRLGLISDIHGNRVALDAVVADGTRHGVDAWWALGDLVAIGPEPVATLERLRSLPGVRFVRGNTDRYVVTGARPAPHADDVERDPTLRPLFLAVEASFAWTRDQMGTADIAWLGSLPMQQRTVLRDGTRLLGVHATPRSDDGPGITPAIADHELTALLGGVDDDLICGGHTHLATDRQLDATRAINLGSISNPITSDLRASYVIVDHDGSGHDVRHRRVDYDHDAVVARIRASGHPEAEYLVSFQRGEQARHPAVRPGTPGYDD